MDYTDTIDQECLPLCDAINRISGIDTFESCCGHGDNPFRIWFSVNNLEALPQLLYFLDG
jgi:hypothetical protein